MLGLYKVAYNF